MMRRYVCLLGFVLLPAQAQTVLERCLLDQLALASGETSVADLRAACASQAPAPSKASVVTRRLQEEEDDYSRPYAITSHRMNYVLPLGYNQNRPSSEPFRNDVDGGAPAQKVEAKFQLSLKFPILFNVLGSSGDLFAGYTQRSFWQMYNAEASKPFRETNFEPEIWYQYPINRQVAGWNLVGASLGLNHQSNGRAQEFSRSWNRVMGGLIFERGEYAMMLRPWWKLKEDPNNDDNPEISHYMGSFDFSLGRKLGQHSFEMVLRNNLQRRGNRGALQLGWSFPLPYSVRMRGYVQWFNGYGESLIDYKFRQNSLGAGVLLADW